MKQSEKHVVLIGILTVLLVLSTWPVSYFIFKYAPEHSCNWAILPVVATYLLIAGFVVAVIASAKARFRELDRKGE